MLFSFFLKIWNKITFKAFRQTRSIQFRRERYEFLKSKISERHFGGYAGLVVDFPSRRFDIYDIGCFKPPMYAVAKNQDMKWCIFWDRNRLTREIGTGAPLKEGEELLPDTQGRTQPSATLDTIDEKKDLVIQSGAHDGSASVV